MAWDPKQYLRFEGHRVRPAIELLLRIAEDHPANVVDLGCGTGNTTALLAQRWPDARMVGVDNSKAMLAVAEHDMPKVTWLEDDVENLDANTLYDVVFSNAALHWIGNHHELLPRLLTKVAPGGTFAMQVPDNFSEPTHTSVVDTIYDGPWQETLEPQIFEWPVLSPSDYARVLQPASRQVDCWSTTYVQVLTGDNPVAQWTKGSALRPYLAALEEDQADEFFEAYAERILAAYPPEPDGTTLLPFRRVFAVATVK